MASYVPLADGVQAELVFLWGPSVVSNRLWFTFDNPPFTTLDMQGVTDGLVSWYTSLLLPALSSDITLALARATDWTGGAPGSSVVTLSGAAGGIAENSYSANVAVRVNFRWPTSVRERKNCHFVPGIPDSAVTLNTINPVFADIVFEAYAALIDRARLFEPILNWRWMVSSMWDANVLRSAQFARECVGPAPPGRFKLGQRRKRLP